MQVSHERHDHQQRHRYCSRLCARQHRPNHRVPVGRVRDRMVHRSAARAPPRTARRRVTYAGDVIGQRDHRADTGDRHQAPAHVIVPDDGRQQRGGACSDSAEWPHPIPVRARRYTVEPIGTGPTGRCLEHCCKEPDECPRGRQQRLVDLVLPNLPVVDTVASRSRNFAGSSALLPRTSRIYPGDADGQKREDA
jgi:hypothetical protein